LPSLNGFREDDPGGLALSSLFRGKPALCESALLPGFDALKKPSELFVRSTDLDLPVDDLRQTDVDQLLG
jgi:hypothetical protein